MDIENSCIEKKLGIKWQLFYQLSEASKPNFFKWGKWPPWDEVPIKVVKEAWEPPNHDFMVWPPLH